MSLPEWDCMQILDGPCRLKCLAKPKYPLDTNCFIRQLDYIPTVEKQLIIDDKIYYSAFQNNGNRGTLETCNL